MRAFLALEFPDTLKGVYAEALRGFEERFSDLRWVCPECLHLTLRFLGEITEAMAEDLREPVLDAARAVGATRLVVGEAGYFGPRSAPRVLWLAVAEGEQKLARLQPALETASRRLGLAPEKKPWSAHVTVARSRRRQGGRRRRGSEGVRRPVRADEWLETASSSPLPGTGFVMDGVTLLRSRTTPDGPVYTPLWKASFAAESDLSPDQASS